MRGPQQEQPFLLAEQLLMTARLLSNDLDQQQRGDGFSSDRNRDEDQRRQLIRMLREEAARCLNKHSRTQAQPPSPHAHHAPIPHSPAYPHRG